MPLLNILFNLQAYEIKFMKHYTFFPEIKLVVLSIKINTFLLYIITDNVQLVNMQIYCNSLQLNSLWVDQLCVYSILVELLSTN